MTICGYNETMGNGLRLLFDGVYEAVDEKASMEGIRFDDVLQRELIEIPEINAGLRTGSRSVSLRMFEGLNSMVLPFFEHLRGKCDSEGRLSKSAFDSELELYIEVLKLAEDESLRIPTPKGNADIQERAANLGRWIAGNLG